MGVYQPLWVSPFPSLPSFPSLVPSLPSPASPIPLPLAPLNTARPGLWKHCKPPQQGLGRAPAEIKFGAF